MKKYLATLLALVLALGMCGMAESEDPEGAPPAREAAAPSVPSEDPVPATTGTSAASEGATEPRTETAGESAGDPSATGTEPPAAETSSPEGSTDIESPEDQPDDSSPAEGKAPSPEDSGTTPDVSDPEGGDGADGSDSEPAPSQDPLPGEDGGASELSREQILNVQAWLIALEYLREGQKTGVYDEATRSAVARFQADSGLPADGACDDATYALLSQRAAEAESGGIPDGGSEGGSPEGPGEDPEGFPSGGGFPGGGHRGGRSFRGGTGSLGRASGAEGDGAPADDPLNGITPGEALTSAHRSGDRDSTRYGALSSVEDADLSELNIHLRTGETEASLAPADIAGIDLEAGRLRLDGGGDSAQEWTLDGLALRTLARSGVDTLELCGGAQTVSLRTSDALSGPVYAALRARGQTDNTFAYTVTLAGGETRIEVAVGGNRYDAVDSGDGLELTESNDGEAGT